MSLAGLFKVVFRFIQVSSSPLNTSYGIEYSWIIWCNFTSKIKCCSSTGLYPKVVYGIDFLGSRNVRITLKVTSFRLLTTTEQTEGGFMACTVLDSERRELEERFDLTLPELRDFLQHPDDKAYVQELIDGLQDPHCRDLLGAISRIDLNQENLSPRGREILQNQLSTISSYRPELILTAGGEPQSHDSEHPNTRIRLVADWDQELQFMRESFGDDSLEFDRGPGHQAYTLTYRERGSGELKHIVMIDIETAGDSVELQKALNHELRHIAAVEEGMTGDAATREARAYTETAEDLMDYRADLIQSLETSPTPQERQYFRALINRFDGAIMDQLAQAYAYNERAGTDYRERIGAFLTGLGTSLEEIEHQIRR